MTKQQILQYFCDINMAYNNSNQYDTLARMIDELLTEQESEQELEGGGSTWWYVCGECHGAIDDRDAYCRHCGRRIKRNE